MAVRLRVEFLVPLKYPNGVDIEPERLFEVREEVVKRFGAITIHPLSTEGVWISPKTNKRCCDVCKRFEVSIDKNEENEKSLIELKKRLMKMFKQEEIYMLYTEVVQL